jgi:hypothetical protein
VLRILLRHKLKVMGATLIGSATREVDTLVERLDDRGLLQPFDLILDHQFPALQLGYLQVVR